MERLSDLDGHFPRTCFTCPARVFVSGSYCCDTSKLDGKSLILNVARYRPESCPNDAEEIGDNISPEIILRKILGK